MSKKVTVQMLRVLNPQIGFGKQKISVMREPYFYDLG
jgi:hypothetical protein